MPITRKHPVQKAFALKQAFVTPRKNPPRVKKTIRAEDLFDAEDITLLHAVVKASARDLAK